MHYLSGITGVVFLILTLLSWETPWIGGFYLACAILAFLAIRPSQVSWLLYTYGISSAVAAAFFFYRFFVRIQTLSGEIDFSAFDFQLLAMFVGGFMMMFLASEYSCWLKGRQERVKIKIQFRKWRERSRMFVASRSR